MPAPPELTIPWVESPFFAREVAARAATLGADRTRIATEYHDQGYVVLHGLAPIELCDRVLAECEPFFEEEYSKTHRRVPDAWNRGADSVRELALLPEIQDLLRALYDRRPIPFQTLDFKWGTEQGAHADAIHFTCLPARYMCGVWVALEDVDLTNGPVFYYPGSHRLPDMGAYDFGTTDADLRYDRFEHVQIELMRDRGIEPIEFHAKKGDVLIWASNILHGGAAVTRAGATRWSQVTHYYFEGCTYYAPIYSDELERRLFLKDITDLNTMEPVPQCFGDIELRVEPQANGRSRIFLPGRAGVPGHEEAAPVLTAIGSIGGGTAQALAAAQAELETLKSSTSYRLGRTLLAPARAVRRSRATARARPPE